MLWVWFARGRVTRAGLVLVAIGMAIPTLAALYAAHFNRALRPAPAAQATADGFMAAVSAHDVRVARALVSPMSTRAWTFAETPFPMTGYRSLGFTGAGVFRYAIAGHPAVRTLRVAVARRTNRYLVTDVEACDC